MKLNLVDLRLIIMRALWGNVHYDMRAIAFSYIEEKSITLYFYLNSPLTDLLNELIESVITEVLSDLTDPIKVEKNIIFTDEPLGKLKAHSGWIFVRYES